MSTVTDTAFQNDKGALCRTSILNGYSLFCFAARDGFAQSINGALLPKIYRFPTARGQVLLPHIFVASTLVDLQRAAGTIWELLNLPARLPDI